MKPVEPSSKRRWSRHRKEMCIVSKRLETFKKISWSLSSPSPEQLSAVGFYYNPIQKPQQRIDNVTCFMCSKSFYDWEENDDPLKEHITHSPSCPWAYVLSARNNPHQDPKAPSLTKCRELTFVDKVWPYINRSDFHCQPNTMATAGFVFTPSIDSKDAAHCLYCNIDLHDWESDDDPYKEHQRRRPNCLFFTWKDPTALSPTKYSLLSSSNVDFEDVSLSELVSNSSEKNLTKPTNEPKPTPRRRISSLSQSHPFSLYSNTKNDSSLVQPEHQGSSPSKPFTMNSPKKRGKQLSKKTKEAVFKPARPIFSDEDEDDQPNLKSSPPKHPSNTSKKPSSEQDYSSYMNGSHIPINTPLPPSTPPSPNRTDESYHSVHSPMTSTLPPIQEDVGELNSKENSVNFSTNAEHTNAPSTSPSTIPTEPIANSNSLDANLQISKKRKSSEVGAPNQQQTDIGLESTIPTAKRQSSEYPTASETKVQSSSSESELEAFSAETSIFEDFPQNQSNDLHGSSYMTNDDEPLARLLESTKHTLEKEDDSPTKYEKKSEKAPVSPLKDNSSSPSLEAVHTPTSDFGGDSVTESETLTASSITPTRELTSKDNGSELLNTNLFTNSSPEQNIREQSSNEIKTKNDKGDYHDSKPLQTLTNIERTALKRPSSFSKNSSPNEGRALLDSEADAFRNSRDNKEELIPKRNASTDISTNSATSGEVFHDSERAFSEAEEHSEKESRVSRASQSKIESPNPDVYIDRQTSLNIEDGKSIGYKNIEDSLEKGHILSSTSPEKVVKYGYKHSLHSTPKDYKELDELPEFSASPSKFVHDTSKSPFDPLSQSSFLAPSTPMKTKCAAPPSIQPSLPPWEPVDFSSLLKTPANKYTESENLTEQELDMTVEHWIKYQYAKCAKTFEEECERQIEWLLKEGKRAEDYIQSL
ncbi:survivin [Schizosaccharomyces octosporus yFS286]|uniref:Survivin n=1 Tax=Schizosaccharomyces octosporus (strain yFS286) TaxID=483514 RepID=S9RCR6_SCHOY|nr:survivin [Schizosaccharomyces octosporus yFS286]EPX71904.1 survivin [Schizosaccharomyces octosporus yFS286]